MRLALALLLALLTLSCSAKPKDDPYPHFKEATNGFFQAIHPRSGGFQRDEFSRAIWFGTGGDIEAGFYLSGIAVKETSLRMRKYQKDAKQNKDYLGAKNEIALSELKAQGYIDGPFKHKNKRRGPACWTPSARLWLDALTDNPELGTMLASMWFMRLLKDNGGDYRETVMQWKYGSNRTATEEISCLVYYNDVKWLAHDMRVMFHQSKVDHGKEQR